MVQITTKTKTVVAVALAVVAIGSMLVGLNYAKVSRTTDNNRRTDLALQPGIDLRLAPYHEQVEGGFVISGGQENDVSFWGGIDIKNGGTETAGPFKVKLSIVKGSVFNNNLTMIVDSLATVDVPGLKGGEVFSHRFENLRYSNVPIHQVYSFLLQIDSENQVAEYDENNNLRTRTLFVNR